MQFDVLAQTGEARRGRIEIDGRLAETPAFFPVVNFYAGGRERSLFGGGVFRTIKEFMIGDERVGGIALPELFPGCLMSIASLFDYGDSEEKIEYYLKDPLREWGAFSGYDGLLFLDSGGFKFMNSDIDHPFLETVDQRFAYDVQRQISGDIIVNLDYPIAPDTPYDDRKDRAERTIQNAVQLVELAQEGQEAIYITVHGHSKAQIERFLDRTEEVLEDRPFEDCFDGVAIGSLVPFKENYGALIKAVSAIKESLIARDLDHLPLHVFGLSSASIPLLSVLGVDSFDSATYVYSAINGKYHTSLVSSVPLSDADFSSCSCAVCRSPQMVDQMRGNAEYQKDILGPVAVHNLHVQQSEIASLREAIQTGERESLARYLEEEYTDHANLRRFAYRVVNRSLIRYFE